VELVEDEAAEPPPPALDELVGLEGQVLAHYRVGPLLGRGHAGLVFRAENVKSGQAVALKVLAPEFPAASAELQRFVQALKVLPSIQHAHLVTLYGAGKTGPHCWIAREYVEGEGASRLIRRIRDEGKYDWTRACRVVVHLGRALALLHKHKLTHGN